MTSETDASPDRVSVALYVPMSLDAAGNGPADPADTARIEHQVWDAATNETLCAARDEATGKRIAAALSAAPRPTGEAVAWRGQTDGIDECTVRPETRDDWTRYGRKITPLYAIPPAPLADSGSELREPARDDPFWTALEAFMFRHGVMAAVEIADVDALRAEALAQPAPQGGAS